MLASTSFAIDKVQSLLNLPFPEKKTSQDDSAAAAAAAAAAADDEANYGGYGRISNVAISLKPADANKDFVEFVTEYSAAALGALFKYAAVHAADAPVGSIYLAVLVN